MIRQSFMRTRLRDWRLREKKRQKMNLRITNDGNEQDILDVFEMLKAYNLSKLETSEVVPVGVYYEDENGRKFAGLTGEIFGNWLCIKYLVVDESLRSQGIGSKLLTAVEEEARNRGCRFSFVDTFSFQAPDFYVKHGYKEVFTLKEYPITGARYYYTKEL